MTCLLRVRAIRGAHAIKRFAWFSACSNRAYAFVQSGSLPESTGPVRLGVLVRLKPGKTGEGKRGGRKGGRSIPLCLSKQAREGRSTVTEAAEEGKNKEEKTINNNKEEYRPGRG